MKKTKKNIVKSVAVPVVAVAGVMSLMGCAEDIENTTADVRFFHASPDAPKVNISLNGNVITKGLDYNQASSIYKASTGDNAVKVTGIIPGGNKDVIAAPLSLTEKIRYDVLAVNNVSGIEPVVIATPREFDTSKVRLRVAHLAPAAPAVDVYVTAPDAALPASPLLTGVSFKGYSNALTIGAGKYQIRIAPEGTTNVVFDSGALTLTAGSDLLVAATENVRIKGEGKSPVALAVISDKGAATVFNNNDGAHIKVGHFVSNAPAVDVVANNGFNAPLFANAPYNAITAYKNVPAATYNVKVVPNGATTPVVLDTNLPLNNGDVKTVLALGQLTAGKIDALVVDDAPRAVATEAKVRVIHASSAAGSVDVYVTAPGADIASASPVLSNIPLKANSGYLSLAAGKYDVTVTPSGQKTAAIFAPINVEAGKIYTAIARDAKQSAGLALGLNLSNF